MSTAKQIIAWVEATDDMYCADMPHDMAMDALALCNIPTDAAEFICEWYPEMLVYAYNRLKFGYYDWATFGVMTEDELAEMLAYNDCSEEEYVDKYGTIIRDAAFDGVLVAGE